MKKNYTIKYLIASFVTVIIVMCCMSTKKAEASHFRYGHLTWQKLQGNTARFTLVNAFRNGYFGSAGDGFPAVNDIITENIGGTVLFSGDNTSTSVLQYKVISIDIANNWLLAVALENANNPAKETIDHTYPSATDNGNPRIPFPD